jgi:signal peptidase I
MKSKGKKSRNIINTLWLTAVSLFIIWAVIGHRYRFTYNKGESMEPAYYNGEWMIVEKRNKLPKDWIPDKYDVVVIEDKGEGENLCKRVIGTPGDKIEIKEGYIFLNGEKLEDPYGNNRRLSFFLCDGDGKDLYYWGTNEKVVQYVNQEQITVPKGYVWVIGDNRTVSWFGQLPLGDIKGLVIL